MPIAAKPLERFMNQARIKLPGASDHGILAELYEVLREFFEETNCWTEVIPFSVVANTQDYLLIPREDGTIIRLIGVRDHNLRSVNAFMDTLGTVTLVWPPNTTPPTDWEAKVVKNVTLPVTRDHVPIVPNDLFQRYETCTIDGLLGRMMGQQAKSYSNSTLSVYHLRRFRSGLVSARTAAARQNTVGAQTWAYPQNFATSNQRSTMSTAFPRF